MWQKSYQHTECVKKNLADKCLPIDYFIERMLQVGLCRNLRQIKHILKFMENFDIPGMQVIKNPKLPQRRKSYYEIHFAKYKIYSDDFKLLNRNNTPVERHIRYNLDRDQFKKFDRISINQFLSLFNVHGVRQAKLLDRFLETIKHHYHCYNPSPKPLKHTMNPGSASVSSLSSSPNPKTPFIVKKSTEIVSNQPTRCLSADHRRLIGLAVHMLSKKRMLGHLDEKEFMVCGVEGARDHSQGMYKKIKRVFTNIIKSKEYLDNLDKVKKMRERRLSRETVQLTGNYKKPVWEYCRLGHSIYSKDIIIDVIENVTQSIQNYQDNQQQKQNKSKNKAQHIGVNSQYMLHKFFEELLDNYKIEQATHKQLLPWMFKGKTQIIEKTLKQRMAEALDQEMHLTSEDIRIRKVYREALRRQKYQSFYTDQFKQRCSEAHDRMDVIGKQMLLDQICIDIIVITQIIDGVIKAEKPKHQTLKDNQSNNTAYQKNKQTYKLLFRQYVMQHLREKYANQAYLYIHQDFHIKIDINTQTEFESQGVKARGILLEICALLMKAGTKLKYNVAQDWYKILSSNQKVCKLVNYLTNMIQDQINMRMQFNRVPNEDFEQLVETGKKIWQQITIPNRRFHHNNDNYNIIYDTNALFIPRHKFDIFLIEQGIVSDKKEVNTFLRGTLNGQVIKQTDTLKNSEYMQLLYKALMRDSILNIINHLNLGQDLDYTPLNGKIQRLQRRILYAGIRTKNTRKWSEVLQKQTDKEKLIFGGAESYSQSCVEIIEVLQKIKHDPMVNKAKCQIKINQFTEWLERNRQKLTNQNGILSSLDKISATNPELTSFEPLLQKINSLSINMQDNKFSDVAQVSEDKQSEPTSYQRRKAMQRAQQIAKDRMEAIKKLIVKELQQDESKDTSNAQRNIENQMDQKQQVLDISAVNQESRSDKLQKEKLALPQKVFKPNKSCSGCQIAAKQGKSIHFLRHICKNQLSQMHYKQLELRKRAKQKQSEFIIGSARHGSSGNDQAAQNLFQKQMNFSLNSQKAIYDMDTNKYSNNRNRQSSNPKIKTPITNLTQEQNLLHAPCSQPTHSFLPLNEEMYVCDRGHVTLIERQHEQAETVKAFARMAQRLSQSRIGSNS